MKSREIRVIIVVVVLILASAVWQIIALILDNRPITNYPPKGRDIIALGDSLTAGVGASDAEHGFIPLLEKRLDISITNKGVIGDTTAHALRRLSTDVLSEKPDIVIVLLGGNDYLRKVPPNETFSNLRSIITQIQSEGAVVLLLGVRGGILNDHFEENFELLAKETGSVYVPNVLEGIFGVDGLMSDQIHPNDRGYEKIVDKVAPSLLGLISITPKKVSTE